MKLSIRRTSEIFFLIGLPAPAFAFDFGFVRVPDWMDFYFIILLGALVLLWIILQVIKPSGVPFRDLRKIQLEGSTKILFRTLQVILAVTLVMLFIGMGLARNLI